MTDSGPEPKRTQLAASPQGEVGLSLAPEDALRLVEVQALVGLGTWDYDAVQHRLTVSPWLADSLGYGSDTILTEYRSLIPSEDLPAFDAMSERARERSGSYGIDHRLILKSGAEWYVHTLMRSFHEDGHMVRMSGAVQDISERKRMEQALTRSEERWQLALRSSNEGVWDWDVLTNAFYYSDHMAELLGLTPEEIGQEFDLWTGLMHPDDRQPTMRAIVAHFEGATPIYQVEHRLRHRDGSYRWVSARGSAIRNAEGKPTRLIGISADITDRKEMALALRERDDLLRAAVEASFDRFFILRCIRGEEGKIEDFAIVELNRRASEGFGRARDAMIGQRLLTLVPRALEWGLFDRYIEVVQTREPMDEEICLPGPTGEQWLHIQAIAVQDGVAVTASDITQRKRDEEALRASERLVQRIANSVPEFLYIFDLDRLEVIYRNRSLLVSLGYSAETQPMLTLAALARVTHPEDADKLYKLVEDLRADSIDVAREIDVRFREINGDYRWFLLRSTVFHRDDAGRPLEALGSAQDVTESKRYEARLKEQMQELEAAHAELRRLNERLKELANRDGLTEVYNHRAFQEKLSIEVSRASRTGSPLALLMADIDDFKDYNDRFGHVAGDLRLKQFAERLQQGVRAHDFVARYGGEEFAIILPQSTAEQASAVAERILEELNSDETEHRITASFGCAELTATGDAASLIAEADASLYRSKRLGKNRVMGLA